MAEVSISNVQISYGTISFVRGRDPVPASVIREGNVTTHNAEIAGKSNSFDVSFYISFNAEQSGTSELNDFTLRFPVVDKSADTPYFDVVKEGLELIPSILRIVADDIEQQISDGENDDPLGIQRGDEGE